MNATNFTQISKELDDAQRQALARAGDADKPLALVAFDTPGIQRYLFKVRRHVDVYGGSHLIDEFNRIDAAARGRPSVARALHDCGVPASAVIYAGGGGGLILTAANQAQALCDALEHQLAKATKGDLRTVSTFLTIRPEDLTGQATVDAKLGNLLRSRSGTSRYATAVSAVMRRLDRKRSAESTLQSEIPADLQLQRCAACGERTSGKGIGGQRFSATDEWLCECCAPRREEGGTERRDRARTLEEIVGEDEPFLAVLYADGANFGNAFRQVASMAQHRALSIAVEDAFEGARQHVVEKLRLQWRYQTPIRGGDDLLFMLPGSRAFEAAQLLVREVEKRLSLGENKLLSEAVQGAPASFVEAVRHFGVGVGLIFADHHFPAQFVVDTARQLLYSAKAGIRRHRCQVPSGEPQEGKTSAADFLVLQSGNPLSGSIAELRKRHLRRKPVGREPGVLLTRRPYSFGDFETFLERTRRLVANVPTSQIHNMRQEVLRGYSLSRSLWLYQHARAREGRPGWAAYREQEGVDLPHVESLLWRDEISDDGNRWVSTDLLDAVEILDVRPKEGA